MLSYFVLHEYITSEKYIDVLEIAIARSYKLVRFLRC